MRPTSSSGLALLVLGAFGCGGSLGGDSSGRVGSGDANGAGGTASSGARADGGSIGVGSDGGGTSVDGAAYIGNYTWGDVMVHVAPTSIAPGTFVLEVTDLTTNPNVVVTSTYQSASGSNPLEGAFGRAVYGCASGAVTEVLLYTCAHQGSVVADPGCLSVYFDSSTLTGDYVSLSGASCVIKSGTANIQLPVPLPPVDGTPPDAATGSFMLECDGNNGARMQLNARFDIFVRSGFLLC
jgi:hypothetical protein